MLHNRLLKFDGLDQLGAQEKDWIAAALNEDDRRIDGAHDEFMTRMQMCAIHNPDMEREETYFHLRESLIQHYSHAWRKKEVLWRKCASATSIASSHDVEEGDLYDSTHEEFAEESNDDVDGVED